MKEFNVVANEINGCNETCFASKEIQKQKESQSFCQEEISSYDVNELNTQSALVKKPASNTFQKLNKTNLLKAFAVVSTSAVIITTATISPTPFQNIQATQITLQNNRDFLFYDYNNQTYNYVFNLSVDYITQTQDQIKLFDFENFDSGLTVILSYSEPQTGETYQRSYDLNMTNAYFDQNEIFETADSFSYEFWQEDAGENRYILNYEIYVNSQNIPTPEMEIKVVNEKNKEIEKYTLGGIDER